MKLTSPLTKQDMLDNVWEYFIVQKHPQACSYRGSDSNCAIGCQIPDALYKPEMENLGVPEIFEQFQTIREHFGHNKDVAAALQSAHDCDFENLETRLRRIAKIHNLQIKE